MLYRLFLFVSYHLWLALPFRLAASRFGLWLLAYAGEYAHGVPAAEWMDEVEDAATKPF